MDNREAGLLVLYNRIKEEKTSLGIQTFRRTPSSPIEKKDLLCVFMSEGVDKIVKPNSRNWLGYPARRQLEIIFELINVESFDFRYFYICFRRVVLSSPKLVEDSIAREIRANGPFGYSIPGVVGIQLILQMSYTDKGDLS